MWGLGLPALFALNIHRDIAISRLTYTWAPVQWRTFHATLTTDGNIEAASVKNVKAEMDGAVQTVLAQEGQRVQQGQPLIEFSSTQAAFDITRKSAQCRSLEADIQKLRKRLDAQKKLSKRGGITRSSIEETVQSIEALKSQFATALKERAAAQKKLRELHVRAPVTGTVLNITAKGGTVVMTGDPLWTMTDESKFIFRTKVDNAHIRKISVGQSADLTLDGLQAETLNGVVKSIGPQGAVTIEIPNDKKLSLVNNAAGHATFHFDGIASALTVPLKAVEETADGESWLTVRTRRGWMSHRRVKLGQASDDWVQVVNGLDEGDSVGVLSTDITAAGADAIADGGDSDSIDASSRSKNRSSLDHSFTNKP
jgi:RND family efflux transporter MFP subunit